MYAPVQAVYTYGRKSEKKINAEKEKSIFYIYVFINELVYKTTQIKMLTNDSNETTGLF